MRSRGDVKVRRVPVWLWLVGISAAWGYAIARSFGRQHAGSVDAVQVRAVWFATSVAVAMYLFGAYALWLLFKFVRARRRQRGD